MDTKTKLLLEKMEPIAKEMDEWINMKRAEHNKIMQGDSWLDIVPTATVPEASPSGSIKNDRLDHKLRWELLPLDLVEHLVAVYTFGAEKYSENSWQNLPDGYRRYKAALFRHIVAFEKGETIDPESGLPHLAHAAWNALALIYFSNQQTPDNNGN